MGRLDCSSISLWKRSRVMEDERFGCTGRSNKTKEMM